MQRSNYFALDTAELGRLHSFVSGATAKGVVVIVEPHNFQRYYPDPANFQSSTNGLVGSAVPDSVFTNFWLRVADIYKTNDHVIFNLMNEPNAVPTAQLLTSENAAIAAIRSTGATNLILVPGNRWTGAWTWNNSDSYGQANSTAMLNIVDSGNNFAFDVHQYLDYDGSGTHTNIGGTSTTNDATIGATRLVNFTTWLRNNNRKGFLGEFAVANSTIGSTTNLIGDEALTNMLGYIQTNADVWLGWSWWAAGPWWSEYMFTLEPTNLGQPGQADRAAMPILRSFIPLPTPSLVISNIQFRFLTQAGFAYQPQASATVTGGWTNFGPTINGSGLTTNVSFSATGARGFYRVRVSRLP